MRHQSLHESLASSGYSEELVRSLAPDLLRELQRLTTPKLTRYIPHQPTIPQTAFLLLEDREALYGGAAGGGKSDALLMGALQYVDTPGYAALLLRKTYADLSLPEAIMARANEWLRPTDGRWDDHAKTWTFPSRATLTFGYLDTKNDHLRYQGAAFQFIGFDELTQFPEYQYRYLFSRLRRLKGSRIPIRMRGATNPGGPGHAWVRNRFFLEKKLGRRFVPARLQDNPYLDEEYRESLAELDPVTRRRLEDGDWEVEESGGLFNELWFEVVDRIPPQVTRWARVWDMAATKPTPSQPDPDWTRGVKMGELNGEFWIADMRGCQDTPGEVKALIKRTAEEDGPNVEIGMEQEPGSSGKTVVDDYARVLRGFTFLPKTSTGDKVTRARPFSAAVYNRKVKVLRAGWNRSFFDELKSFPVDGFHDDQVDVCSSAHERLSRGFDGVVVTSPVSRKPKVEM